jgi:hypothetical protein
MNTKEMTEQEALDFLKNKKILCRSEKESVEVQKKILEVQKKLLHLDCIWRTINKRNYLFFLDNINTLTSVDNFEDWITDSREELKVQDLLDIKIKENKPKFNPNDLKPFDKVLVRCSDNTKWGVDFFSYKDEESHSTFRCIGYWYSQCIPYNEETKHLVSTCQEAPEYYITWK